MRHDDDEQQAGQISSTMAKGDKKAASRAAEVMTIETTINLSKRLHGMYVLVLLLFRRATRGTGPLVHGGPAISS